MRGCSTSWGSPPGWRLSPPPLEEVFFLLPGGWRLRFLPPFRLRAFFSWAGISCRVAEVGRGRWEEAWRLLRRPGRRFCLSPELRQRAGKSPFGFFSLCAMVEASFRLLPLPPGEVRGLVVGPSLEAAVALGRRAGQLFLAGRSPRVETLARCLYRDWGIPAFPLGDLNKGLRQSDMIIAVEDGEGEVRPEAVLWDLSPRGLWGGGRGFREVFFRFPLRFPGAPPGLIPSWAAEALSGGGPLELGGMAGRGGRVVSLDTGEAGYLEYGAPKVEREMEEKEEVVLTREGLRKLEEELEYLKTIKRREVAERIRLAREFGDLAENAEYDEAKNEQAFLESRILILEKTLRQARVVVEEELEPDRVNVGSRVVLEDLDTGEEFHYTVVGPSEADPSASRISYRSPVGRAVMGRVPGEVVEVRLPYGVARYRVKSVSR